MSDSSPTTAPNSAPEAPEGANVFGYDVASEANNASNAQNTPSPHSPLAAGWNDWKRSIYSWMD